MAARRVGSAPLAGRLGEAAADDGVDRPEGRRGVAEQVGPRATRMCGQRDRGGVPGGQAALQFVGEQQVRQLRLRVCGVSPIASGGLQVVEVQGSGAVAEAGDGDDPGRRGGAEPVEEESGQSEVSQVVDARLCLEAVLGVGVGRPPDSGVVDEQVQTVVASADLVGGGTHRRE